MLIQVRDFSEVPHLPFFDSGPNKQLCPLFQRHLFGVCIVTVRIPAFSECAHQKDEETVEKSLFSGSTYI